MKIGVLVLFHRHTDINAEFIKIRAMDMNCCQLCCWEPDLYTAENAKQIIDAAAETGVEITALWAGWTGPKEWNFYGGPVTLGLVPSAYRSQRVKELLAASDFARMIDITDIITHVGFLPENPCDPDFQGAVTALRLLANELKDKGQYFLFETGQETPITMLRTIEEIGTMNLGINFDTANLLLYGKANPADALDIFGKYVRNTHFKDGEYPVCGRVLGKEKPLGQGRADIPLIIRKLRILGYTGPLIIEREISGSEQDNDIVMARDLLRSLLA
ncbi:MAG: sugar phosphate isomerase/epimerase family protein [Oscillospiraceae bacterium]|nr:sugar phosphate isomerase/epimerase family protein [Oscillospiraceae bacterium]